MKGKQIFLYTLISILSILNVFTVSSFDEVRMMHRSLWAHYLQYSQDTHIADAWYKELLSMECPPYVYKGYIQFLHAAEKHKDIIAIRSHINKNFKDDAEVQLLLALALKKTGYSQESDELIVQLSRSFGDHGEIVFYATEILVQRKELENALSLLTNFINRTAQKPNIFIYHFLKAQIAMQMGRYDDALKDVQLCIEKHNKFDKGWLLMALISEQAGNIQDAVKGYTQYLELSSEPNKEIKQHLTQLIMQQQMGHVSVPMQTHNDYYKALELYRQKSFEKASLHLSDHLKKNPNDADARLLSIQILLDTGNVQQALRILGLWIQEDVNNELWYKTVFLIAKNKACTNACAIIINTVHDKHPSAQLPLLYAADLYTRCSDNARAALFYEKIINTAKDTQVKAKALYQLSAIYYDTGNYNELVKLMTAYENIAHTFAPLSNLYAYYYATKGKNLKKADAFMQSTQKLASNNPHFIDTQALVAYKKGEYAQACTLLEKVAKMCPHDATIQIHYAKAQFKLNKKELAVMHIKNALAIAKNDYERVTSQKLLARWTD
jgi:tetratricopeptide (TPR) repeat protein